MQVGIVGLPVSGKTTLFSTLTRQDVSGLHEGRKVEVHRGIVKVPDRRLDQLAEIFYPKQKIPTTIEYIEVGGIEKEQSKTQGFDPQFLQVLKTTDLLCVVIQAFENEFHPHPEGRVNPLGDIQTVETEFLLSDLSIVENRKNKLEKEVLKAKDEEGIKELELIKRCQVWLESEKPLREMEFSEDERFRLRGFQFLSAKPMVIVVNLNEDDLQQSEKINSQFTAYEDRPNLAITSLCAKVEQEISQLDDEDAKVFLEDMNIEEPALDKLIRTSHILLDLISFFTIGENECQAWTVPKGSNAQKAAGAIHSDMEKGFIRAEVVNFDEFIEHKSFAKCRENGILRLEGKNYIVQDGDIITVRFNV
jgi:GTP-binding protein YchF